MRAVIAKLPATADEFRHASQGPLRPRSGAKVKPDIYDSLIIPRGVSRVHLSPGVIVLGLAEIEGGVCGTLILAPGCKSPDVGPNDLKVVRPRSWPELTTQLKLNL